MSDIAITSANVLASAGATVKSFKAGETLAAGKLVYFDTVAKAVKQADANAVDPAVSAVKGITANNASTGQPIDVITYDPALTLGGTITAGEVVVLSTTAGGVAPVADVASGSYVVVLGIGTGSNKMLFDPLIAGAKVP